jgi:prepilin-type N-terminal cleavage/methylation domain-containing protein
MRSIKTNQKGFTIIEVLIVLAIAALILMIVFLAVPALQRNQRNNARNNDAARVSAAITDCLSNRNGQSTSCDAANELNYGQLDQLTTVNYSASMPGDYTSVSFYYHLQCNNDNSGVGNFGGNSRSFVVLFRNENNVNRCIDSE